MLGSRPMDSTVASTSGQPNYLDYRMLEGGVGTRVQYDPVVTLKELVKCTYRTLRWTFPFS